MKKTKIIAVLAVICLIILIPQSFAMDNETIGNTTDYYFDAGAPVDGNGTVDNPYKNFTDERIIENSTVHLAEGEYVFEKQRSFNNISFYGITPSDTILNGNGNTLTVSGCVNFKNVTLTNFRIVNSGNLTATDTYFTKLLPSHPDDDNYNYYGGAICAFKNKNIFLDNCIFFNNTAPYGGSIYAAGGNLIVINSIFYNSTSDYFGGAIVGDSRVKIIINNTQFFNDKSSGDAGGAIYLLNSELKADNLIISDCSATFGGGITALDSDLDLYNVTFKNNTAKYDGGAIYQYYGSLIVNSTKFISNSAQNGGGLFTNDVNVKTITLNEFVKNTASNCGGGVYSFLSNNYNLSDNMFENNSAPLFDDAFNTTTVSLDFGDGNYKMYILNSTFNSTIPSSYDLRKLGLLTPVKDQQQGGNCWAFAAMASLESCILKASGETLDLSEENMKNLMAVFSDYGRNIRFPNYGGDNDMPVAYLVSWMGPVNDSDDVYDDKSHLSPVLKSLLHVQNVLYLKRNNFTDNDAIKQALMNYGAVATVMYYQGNYLSWDLDYSKICYYYRENENETTLSNHAVTIVGWDDSVRVRGVDNPGAWIVRNSWGPSWLGGNGFNNHNGYFYVSYYDSVFARPGNYNSYTFILNDTVKFDKNYQYDISGVTDYFYVNQSTVWYKNAFNATDNEFLSGVSTYFNKNTSWELSVYVNSKLQLTQNGSSIPGYYTINLNYPVPVMKGDIFEILFKITSGDDAGFPISEAISLTKFTYRAMQSFVSFDGIEFLDLYSLSHSYPNHSYVTQVACIKGFTQLITLNSTSNDFNITYDSADLFNITVSLIDENNNPVRNGNVTFTVNNENFTAEVYNGVASVQIPFKLGLNNISWIFKSPNYCSCSNRTTFEVLPIKLDMNISVILDFNNAYITFTVSQPINETLAVNGNDFNYTLDIVDGRAYLILTSLEYGQYNLTADVVKDIYECKNSTGFFVNVKRTYLETADLKCVYSDDIVFCARLLDQFNQPVVGREVKFRLDGRVYHNVTDENGTVNVHLNLKCSSYHISVDFEGDDSYVSCTDSLRNITVKSSIYPPSVKQYALNSMYKFNLLDKSGDPLKNTCVTLKISGKKYQVITNDKGTAFFTVPFSSGNYTINILNPDTKESLSQNISVLKRLTQNKDMSFYYGSFPDYKIRVCDDNGNFASNLKVKLTINGKTYVMSSDKNGWVLIKIRLVAGKYTIKSEYKGFKVTNKIIVKPTLITKNIKVKKAKTVKFSAKLLNKYGKALKGKKITFKIKGKTYKVKTSKKGIALLKIRNLKVGTYKIVTSYGNMKSVNKIIIRK